MLLAQLPRYVWCRKAYSIKAQVIFVVTIHNNLDFKSSLLFPQLCKKEALNSFTCLQLFYTQLLGKKPLLFSSTLILFTSLPLQALQRSLMHILHLFVHLKKKACISFKFSFVTLDHWSRKNCAVSIHAIVSHEISNIVRAFLLCSFPDIILAWIMELFHMREFT